jgi:hypothetical protein
MIVTLMGPDDLGYWFLVDHSGRDFRIVEEWPDHLYAASLFGWEGDTTDQLVVLAKQLSGAFGAVDVIEFVMSPGVRPQKDVIPRHRCAILGSEGSVGSDLATSSGCQIVVDSHQPEIAGVCGRVLIWHGHCRYGFFCR